jgi:HTH-type transcriptional regulator, transcriptional repressor of NAD biosynthesis genes
MVKRVAIFGTESTGKSTLASGLAAHFGEPWASEFVREFWDDRGGIIEAQDLPTIARGQILNEEVAAMAAERVVFCDTDLLINVRWADELYGGDCPTWMRTAADERAKAYALYLYCEPDLPWTPDPQRCFPDPVAWQASAERCRTMLDERGLSYVRIGGSGEERLRAAILAVECVLAAS